MTVAQLVAALAGLALSIAFSWVPRLKDWYDAQSATGKRGVMILATVMAALLVFALGCAGVVQGVDCSSQGARDLATLVLYAVVTNQTAYSILPQPASPPPRFVYDPQTKTYIKVSTPQGSGS